ncbi:MAG: hypothetical protein H0X41_03945 [Chitinophagaceae bacterium]|nr:hypothetical protein [Chitinophagaceae bacterium]
MVKRPRQAIALLVHRDVSQINSLIKTLEQDFDLYIHVDKKAKIDLSSIQSPNVWSEYKVHWGSYDIVQSTIFLYKKILESKIPYTHVILLSGDSLPVKSNEYIADFLTASQGISFIENLPADEDCLDRRRLIWYKEDLKIRLRGFSRLKNPFKIIRWFQKKLNLKRSAAGFERTGSQWTILALSHVQHMMDHCQFSRYRFTAVPDESFVQNHFNQYNIPYGNYLIYAHWPSKKSFSPHFIDEATYVTLLNSPYLFARKFEAIPNVSARNTVIKSFNQEKAMAYTALISDSLGHSKPYYD